MKHCRSKERALARCVLGLSLWCAAAGTLAQTALQVESVAGARAVKAHLSNLSTAACGVEVILGDGREEKLRLEGREKRTLEHVYAQDGTYLARLRGELFVRGLRTVPPCDVDEAVRVQVAAAAPAAAVPPTPIPLASQPPQPLPLPAPQPPQASQVQPPPAFLQASAAPAPVMPAPPAGSAAPSSMAASPRLTLAPDPVTMSAGPVRPVMPRLLDRGDDMLVWRRSKSQVLDFVTATEDRRAHLVSGDLLRWAGFEVCWLALPGHAEAFGGDAVVQAQVISMLERRLAAYTGGRAVSGRFIDCAAGASFKGQADVLLIQREALPVVRARMSGFAGFEPMGDFDHAEVVRELAQSREAAARRGQVLTSMVDAERVTEERRRQQALAREFPYTATLRCSGGEGAVSVANCLSGRNLRSQLELRNGGVYRVFLATDVSQAGSETTQGLVILLRERFTIETQNVDDRLTLSLRVVNTASGTLVYEQSAERFEMLRLTR